MASAGTERRRSAGVALVVVGIAAVRLEPVLASDPGVFLTMFDGLLDGERLYVDRWDHKDPGFYWMGAVAFGLLGTVGPALLDVALLVLISLGALRLALRSGVSEPSAILISIGAAGFITNPAFHTTGLSEPPGVALLIWSYVFLGESRRGRALVLVSLLSFVKLAFLPLALPVVYKARPHTLRDAGPAVAALAAPLAIAAGILAGRGEFFGWLDSVRFNRHYAQVSPRWFGGNPEGFRGHIDRLVWVVSHSPSLLVSVALLVAILGAIRFVGGRMASHREGLWAMGVFIAAMVPTFATAHMLRGATVALVLLWSSIDKTVAARRSPKVAYVLLAVLAFVASGPHPTDIDGVRSIPQRWSVQTEFADAVQQELDRLRPGGQVQLALSMGPPGEAALPFLSDDIELVCPDHHLLPWFEGRFDDHLDCMATKASHLLVGPLSFANDEITRQYDRRLRAVLEAHFELVGVVSGGAQGEVEVFSRRE